MMFLKIWAFNTFFPKQFTVGFFLRKKRLAAICSGRVPGACPPCVLHVSAFGPPCVVGFGRASSPCPPLVRLVSALFCWLWPRLQFLSAACPPLVPQTVYCGVLSQEKKRLAAFGRHMRWPRPWSLSVMWPPCVRLESALATPPNLVRDLSAM